MAVGGESYELTDSAADIFAWMSGSLTVGAIGAQLSADYGIPHEEAVADVAEFVSWLLERRLAEMTTPPPAAR
ncbi:PqqD family protein [Actinoplanes sp. NEAU-A12]|uniref:PqqD family protein n=1 Tax=Actinoplanes sandaracinus TaxID=3045177 RepID=A0ABT6WRB9_9ACTN|nr:PqqD family protein [Actinoplanes sandaracinus]MDI6102286.1 PqqD family protein [Actinoplanes sandaracinus]